MGLDNQFGSSSLETYTALDAYDGVAYVGIASNSIRCTNLLNLLDGFHFVCVLFAIDGNNLTFIEGNLQQ